MRRAACWPAFFFYQFTGGGRGMRVYHYFPIYTTMEVPVSRKPREAANLPSTRAMDSLSTIHAGAGRLVRAGMVPLS